MHQIQVNAPKEKEEAVAKLALKVGTQQATVQPVHVHGPDKEQDVVTIQTDTPTSRAFVDALMTASFFKPKDYNIASQSMPSLVSSQEPAVLTQSFDMPVTDVFEDLWSRNQINPTYFARAAVSSLLLAYGMIQNDLITMIAALLFTPYLEQALAGGFGLITRQWRLAVRGAIILGISTVITLISGVIVATLMGGPLQFDNFSPMLVNFLISLIVAVVAGFATADLNGRRELIAMAAAAQFAIYPAWFGIMLVLGLPDAGTIAQRGLTFLVNTLTILAVAAAVYVAMRYKADVVEGYAEAVRPKKKK